MTHFVTCYQYFARKLFGLRNVFNCVISWTHWLIIQVLLIYRIIITVCSTNNRLTLWFLEKTQWSWTFLRFALWKHRATWHKILQINPVEILVAPHRAKNVQPQWHPTKFVLGTKCLYSYSNKYGTLFGHTTELRAVQIRENANALSHSGSESSLHTYYT